MIDLYVLNKLFDKVDRIENLIPHRQYEEHYKIEYKGRGYLIIDDNHGNIEIIAKNGEKEVSQTINIDYSILMQKIIQLNNFTKLWEPL